MSTPLSVIAVLNDRTVSRKDEAALDLTPATWALAEDLFSLLMPFKAATCLLSADKNSSVSCILPIVHGLLRGQSVKASDSAHVRELKKTLISQLEGRHHLDSLDADSIPVFVSILDTCFKGPAFLTQIKTKKLCISRCEGR